MKLRFPIGSRGLLLAVGLVIGGMACVSPAAVAANAKGPFLAPNETAMNKMLAGMAVKPTGDVDHDFVAMMVPHHQGALDMAQAELRYGQSPQLKTIAQEIIVDQMLEITLMRLALGEALPQSVSSPTQLPPARRNPRRHTNLTPTRPRCGCLRRCRWLRPGPLAPTDDNLGKEY